MPNHPVRSSRLGRSRLERAVRAETETAQAHGAIAAAREASRVDVIAAVANRALVVTDQISTLEAALIRRRPDERAEARLRFVADTASNAIGNVLLQLDRPL